VKFRETSPRHANGATLKKRSALSIAPHLGKTNWLDFEYQTITNLSASLVVELDRLVAKTTTKRVHECRVMLRRWFSVWKVLKKDGWGSDAFENKVGSKLRKLLKKLGQLRDWDVNTQAGSDLGVPQSARKTWKTEREKVRRKVSKTIDKLDVPEIDDQLKAHLAKQYAGLKRHMSKSRNKAIPESAYERIDAHLSKQEELARKLEAKAKTTGELHELRLEIKRWRYMLAEFFGLTNMELQKAQQCLGKLNDFDRLRILLSETGNQKARAKLDRLRREYRKKFATIRHQLCYGLRPFMASYGS
jgi:CHAD domain-containing protein